MSVMSNTVSKSFAMYITNVRFLSGMNSFMSVMSNTVSKSFAIYITNVRFFSSMIRLSQNYCPVISQINGFSPK